MEKSIKEEKVIEIMNGVSKLLDVEVMMIADDQQKLFPHWDTGAIISKFLGLCVFNGWPTPAVTPHYNRVHADVEFWKNYFEKLNEQPPGT